MWFKVAIKNTNLCTYIELESENVHKLVQVWFVIADKWLNSTIVCNAGLNYYNTGKYPDLCEVEMMEKPPQKWLVEELKMLDKDIEAYTERYNTLSDLLEPENHSY